MEPEVCQLIHMETPTFSEIVVAFHIAYHHRKNEISRFKKLVTFIAPSMMNIIAVNVAEQADISQIDGNATWKPYNDAWKLVWVSQL